MYTKLISFRAGGGGPTRKEGRPKVRPHSNSDGGAQTGGMAALSGDVSAFLHSNVSVGKNPDASDSERRRTIGGFPDVQLFTIGVIILFTAAGLATIQQQFIHLFPKHWLSPTVSSVFEGQQPAQEGAVSTVRGLYGELAVMASHRATGKAVDFAG